MDAMLRQLIGGGIELVTVLGGGLGRVNADPGQLEQVLLNLALNARDAMPRGGRLTIETADVVLDEAHARRHVDASPGRYVRLTVSDTGTGMTAETRARLFEPFFTTKGPSHGAGLGLATVYGIVKQSGGHIGVDSEPGRGTTFRIYLPRVEATAGAQWTGAAPAGPAGSHETILLVEDEAVVRSLAREVLQRHGDAMLAAQHGAEALAIGSRHAGPISLVLTDVVMPGMSGREVAQRLAASRAETKVLYMSGYTDNALGDGGVLDPTTAFLSKPFTPDALVRKVREVLGVPQPS